MDRRNFLRTGGMALAGSLISGSAFAAMTPLGKQNGGSNDGGVSEAMNHFGVSQSDMRKVLAAALEKGGDYADLYFEHTFSNSVNLRDGAVNSNNSNIDFGMGVRVLKGDQTGYAYVENVTLQDMLNAARTAARIASGGQKGKVAKLVEQPIKKNYYTVNSPWEEVTVKDKIRYLQKRNDKIFALDPRVVKVQANQSDVTSYVLFCNSEGVMYYDYRPMVRIGAT